jgi:hypothetical protein
VDWAFLKKGEVVTTRTHGEGGESGSLRLRIGKVLRKRLVRGNIIFLFISVMQMILRKASLQKRLDRQEVCRSLLYVSCSRGKCCQRHKHERFLPREMTTPVLAAVINVF